MIAIESISQNLIDELLWTNDPYEMLGIDYQGAKDKIEQFDYDEFVDLYFENPEGFFIDILNFDSETYQKEIAESVRDFKRTSVVSGQGVGKTAVVACIILWYITTRANAKIIATAPSMNQIYTVLWSELAGWLEGTFIERYLEHTKTKLYMIGHEKKWFAQARTATSKEGIAGLHDDNMLIVVDEASGVKDEILETLLGTITGENNRLLFISNGTRNNGIFYDSHHKDRANFNCIQINAENCKRVDQENVRMLISKYGYESNVARVRVRGLFPLQEDDVMISVDDLEKSIHADFDPKEEIETIDIGCDVARFGDDKTIIAVKVNRKILPLIKRQGQDTMVTAQQLIFICNQYRFNKGFKGIICVKIDDTGVGGGVTDRLNQIIKSEGIDWIKVVPWIFGKAIKNPYYHDTTTYMMAVLRDGIKTVDDQGNSKEVDFILPNDNDLYAQASSRKYELTDKSKIKVESKKVMKKRGVPSPDELDAVLLCILPMKR